MKESWNNEIKRKFEDYQEPAPEGLWEQIEARLDAEKDNQQKQHPQVGGSHGVDLSFRPQQSGTHHQARNAPASFHRNPSLSRGASTARHKIIVSR